MIIVFEEVSYVVFFQNCYLSIFLERNLVHVINHFLAEQICIKREVFFSVFVLKIGLRPSVLRKFPNRP